MIKKHYLSTQNARRWIAWLLLVVFMGLSQQLACVVAQAGAKAIAARVAGDDERTRFVADLDKPVSFTVYVLPDPYRVVIDLPDVGFDLPQGAGRKVRGLVSEFRYGVVEAGRSRIVIDTSGPVLIEKSYLVPPKGDQPARVVVDMVATTAEDFAVAFEQSQVAERGETPHEEQSQAEAQLQQEPASDTDEASKQKPVQRSAGKKLIVLDPGHGGIDPGALSPRGTKEKDVVFAVAKAIKKELQADGRFEVRLTRDDDRFVPLRDRREMARKLGADLFIAIHADTVRGPSARGMTLYTLSDKASDEEAEALASKENQADIIGGMDLEAENPEVTSILIDLAQRESKNHAMLFSKKAVTELRPMTLLTGKPLRSAGFVVLKAPDVPSVLIELGYLSSKQDEALLTSPVWHAKVAKAMVRAIGKYFESEVASKAQ